MAQTINILNQEYMKSVCMIKIWCCKIFYSEAHLYGFVWHSILIWHFFSSHINPCIFLQEVFYPFLFETHVLLLLLYSFNSLYYYPSRAGVTFLTLFPYFYEFSWQYDWMLSSCQYFFMTKANFLHNYIVPISNCYCV